jgi:hypothetical protein
MLAPAANFFFSFFKILLTVYYDNDKESNNLGTFFCRQEYKGGGACIYISQSLQYSIINLEKYHKEKDLEI